jgi:hypothetical protein
MNFEKMMKNFSQLTIIITFLLSTSMSVYGQTFQAENYMESSEGGTQYFMDQETREWLGGYSEKDLSFPDEARYISPQEVNNAAATVEKWGLTPKQKKKLNEKRKREQTIEEQKTKVVPLNPTPYALLRLPVDIKSESGPVHAGFYLLEYRKINGEDIVVLRQGNADIAYVPPSETLEQKQKVRENFAIIESMDATALKVVLNTRYSQVRFTLPVYSMRTPQ